MEEGVGEQGQEKDFENDKKKKIAARLYDLEMTQKRKKN